MQCEGAWSFDRNLVLMQSFEGDPQANKISILKAALSIRLYDLPLYAMNERMVRIISNSVDKVEETDVKKDEVAWGEFNMVKVSLDVTKPLMRGKCINMATHGVCWVQFTYERLPTFYYVCGRLSHSHKDYRVWQNNQGMFKEDIFPFGPCMRASGFFWKCLPPP